MLVSTLSIAQFIKYLLTAVPGGIPSLQTTQWYKISVQVHKLELVVELGLSPDVSDPLSQITSLKHRRLLNPFKLFN